MNENTKSKTNVYGEEELRLRAFTVAFGELIRGMKIADVAERLGLSRATVAFYLRGDRIPDAAGVASIAREFGVSADWLLGLSHVKEFNVDLKRTCDELGLSPTAVEHLKNNHKEDAVFTNFIDYLLTSRQFYAPLVATLDSVRSTRNWRNKEWIRVYDEDAQLENDGRITLSTQYANSLFVARAANLAYEAVEDFCFKILCGPLYTNKKGIIHGEHKEN